MTGCAIRFSYPAQLGARLSSAMVSLTFVVVSRRVRHQFLVRVVAGQATDARIIRVVALAPGQTIGLKTDVPDAQIRLHDDFRPSAMTPPAEL